MPSVTRTSSHTPNISPSDAAQAATEFKPKVRTCHLLSVWRKNSPEQVTNLVQALREAEERDNKQYLPKNFPTKPPYKFDQKLVAAVTEFQENHNLTVDGVVGQQTWAALMGAPNPRAIPPGTDWLEDWLKLREAERFNWNDGFVSELPPGFQLGTLPNLPNVNSVPMFRQGDERWGDRTLGNSSNLRAKGCAVVASAMALSAITNKEIRPDLLDAHLDAANGYSGNNLRWEKAAQFAGAYHQRHHSVDLRRLDDELNARRPVVLGVDYKNDGGIDHWITVKAKAKDSKGNDVYIANDPATGQEVHLYNINGKLMSFTRGGISKYEAKGMVTFSLPNQPPANELLLAVREGRSKNPV